MLKHHDHQPVGCPVHWSFLRVPGQQANCHTQPSGNRSVDPIFQANGRLGNMTQLGPLQLGITLDECFAITSEASSSPGAHPSTLQDNAYPRERMLELSCQGLCWPW